MHAIRVVKISDEQGNAYRIALPDGAKVVGEGESTTVRIDPGDEFAEFREEDGMIEITPQALVQFAKDGIDGFSLVERSADTMSA